MVCACKPSVWEVKIGGSQRPDRQTDRHSSLLGAFPSVKQGRQHPRNNRLLWPPSAPKHMNTHVHTYKVHCVEFKIKNNKMKKKKEDF